MIVYMKIKLILDCIRAAICLCVGEDFEEISFVIPVSSYYDETF